MRSIALVLVLGVLLSAPITMAQQPTILHAKISTRSAEQGLAAQVDQLKRRSEPTWIGYQITVGKNFHSGGNSASVVYLENAEQYDRGPYEDATFDHVNILMRIVNGGIQQLRLENPDRQLDAGGLQLVWFTGVSATDSIRLLQSLALANGSKQLRDNAVFFISIHESPETTPALVHLASAGVDPSIREKAAFWLAAGRGHDGFLAIQELVRDDADPQLREKLAFDLTLCHEPDAVNELIRMAQSDASPQVRRQAQFWMANIAGKKVAAELRESAENDPDAEVRKSAVFALSRLPGDEAATQLMRVAQTSKETAVRKQAIFWLGQSSDPRAFNYLVQLLRPQT